MKEKIFLHLFILGGIFSQGIIGSSSDEEIGKSSDFLVRNKRVINHAPGGDSITLIEDTPYLVHIRQSGRTHCVGAILSHYSVITAASCVILNFAAYQIHVGSGYVHYSITHNLTSKETFTGRSSHLDHHEGIALVTVDPPFNFTQKVGYISLYEGPIHSGIMCTVSGWGYCHPFLRPMDKNRRLRSITIPIMDHSACTNIYHGYFSITDKNICTYHPQKACAQFDTGTPLVIDNKLAGIHVWKGEKNRNINPDVFINTQIPDYLEWIRRNAILM